MSWPTKKLGDLVSFLSGFAWKSSSFCADECGLPIIRIQNVDGSSQKNFIYWPDRYDDRFVIRSGDILLTLSGSFRVEIWDGPDALLNQRIVKITPRDDIDRDWLLHFLRGVLLQIERMGRHSLVNNVALSDLRDMRVKCPPLPAQRRIAAILDQADALRRLRRQSLSRLADLSKRIFEKRFGSVPPTVPLEAAVSDTLIGLVRGAEEFGWEFEIPYVRMDAISTDGRFLPAKVQRTTASDPEIARYRLRSGDMLFNTRNSKELVGKTAIFQGSDPTVYNNNVMRIRFGNDWDPVFVEAYFRSAQGSRDLEKRKSGTTNVWAVYWSQLKTLPLPSVEISQQLEYRAVIEMIWNKQAGLIVNLRALDNLFTSLQHRAFNGEL